AIAQITPRILEQRPPPRGARILLHQHEVAQIATRRPSGLVLRHSEGLTLFRFLPQVELEFLAEFGFHAIPPRQPTQLAKERAHDPSWPAGSRINPIARANAFHFDCSAKSCLRPSAVRR